MTGFSQKAQGTKEDGESWLAEADRRLNLLLRLRHEEKSPAQNSGSRDSPKPRVFASHDHGQGIASSQQ
jgi:hypothetical protein